MSIECIDGTHANGVTFTGGEVEYLLVPVDPGQIAVVTRTSFDTLVDPYTKAGSGLVRLIGRWRICVAAISSYAVAEVGGITP